jgi:hypothetical protein
MLASTYQSSDEWSSSADEDSGAKVSDCSLSTSKNSPIIRPERTNHINQANYRNISSMISGMLLRIPNVDT